MTDETDETDKKHFREGWVAAALTVTVPGLVVAFTTDLRRLIGIRDEEVLAWWPAGSMLTVIPFIIAIPLGLILLVMVGGRDGGSWFRVVRWPWLVLAIATLGGAVANIRADTRVYQDRMVITRYDGARRTIPMSDAKEVEVECSVPRRRRVWGANRLTYSIRFPDFTVALEARVRIGGIGNLSLSALDGLDRGALTAVPHNLFATENCVDGLRRVLDPADVAHAERLLRQGATADPAGDRYGH